MVLKTIQDQDIKYIWMQFTDLNGILKLYGVRVSEMEDFFEQGDGFDGSSISGFGRIEESDMVAVPDPTTFGIIPWRERSIQLVEFYVIFILRMMIDMMVTPVEFFKKPSTNWGMMAIPLCAPPNWSFSG